MTTYYCVTTAFYDGGRTTAGITSSVQAEKKPDNSFTSTFRKDIYNDWFDNYEAAQKFVEEAKAV